MSTAWFPPRRSSSPGHKPLRSIPRLEPLEDRATPATITVTTAADDLTPNDGTVSLREAIQAINAGNDLGDPDITAQTPGTFGTNDTINFNISANAGVQTINVGGTGLGALPALIKPVTINGYSETGASANTQANSDNAKILIQLNGTAAGASADGLTLAAGSAGSTIRGLDITNFAGNGIVIQANGNSILGNFIGVDPTGTMRMPNGTFPTSGDGIRIQNASNNQVGGTSPAGRNVVSGNALDGIHVEGTLTAPATGNVIQGNFVGVAANGTSSVGNRTEPAPAPGTAEGNNFFGIEISGGNLNTVGGTVAGARNVVGFNAAGIEVDNGGQQNVIQGNFVGVGADGSTAAGNLLEGVALRSSNGFSAPLGPAQPNEPGVSFNLIGGTAAGAGNVVAFNGTAGVAVFGNPVSASGQPNVDNAIEGNSIFENGRDYLTASSAPTPLLGIDLTNGFLYPREDGLTANDSKGHGAANDPNNFQNYPVLSSVTAVSGGVQITGTLTQAASPNTTYRIEFFANNPDPLGLPAEGQTFLGATTVTTSASGVANFNVTLPAVTPGQTVTATATDLVGNTSEFSPGLTLMAVTPPPPPTSPPPVSPPADLFAPHPNPDVNTALVHGLYHAILGRDGDAGGVSFFVGQLNSGVSISQVTQEIYSSPEHRGDEVDRYYLKYLNRSSDPGGRTFWVGQLLAGVTEEQVIISFLSSAEYSTLHASNDAYVDALYNDVLGRADNASEHAAAVQLLNVGVSRTALAQGVELSDEARLRLIDGFYESFLQRPSDPTGQQSFLQAIHNGATDAMVAAGFAASAEFMGNAAKAVP